MRSVLQFQTSRYVAECPKVVFDAFVDPDDLNKICLRHLKPVLGLASNPGQIGTTWHEKVGPLSLLRVRTKLVSIDRPRSIAWQKSGAIEGDTRVEFTPKYRGTQIEQKVEIRRHSRFLKPSEVRERTEASLQDVKTHLEPHGSDPLFDRIQVDSPRVETSTCLAGPRSEVHFELKAIITCPPRQLYTILTDLQNVWRWNVDRSDPRTEYDVAGNWPQSGATAAFRFRSGSNGADGWETGRLEVIECVPSCSIILRETQDYPPEAPICYVAHYRLGKAASGCAFSVEFNVGANSLIFERHVRHDSDLHRHIVDHFRKEIANVIRTAEGKER